MYKYYQNLSLVSMNILYLKELFIGFKNIWMSTIPKKILIILGLTYTFDKNHILKNYDDLSLT